MNDGFIWQIPSSCRKHTMVKFVTHESIGSGVFNRTNCAATTALAGWEDILTNSPQGLDLLLQRMEADHIALNAKLRKPYASKDLEN